MLVFRFYLVTSTFCDNYFDKRYIEETIETTFQLYNNVFDFRFRHKKVSINIRPVRIRILSIQNFRRDLVMLTYAGTRY